jgi:predicted negative regulator of RcsB-dependent stress response
MANQLDLEEQEQLDQLKHFWAQYGNLISWLLIAVLSVFASWNAYQYWQRSQAAQAAALFDELERVAKTNDMTKLDRVLVDMKEKFASTSYAQQAALLAAKVYFEAGKSDEAKSSLSWVAEKSSDEGYQAIGRLRLAGILLESKAYDDALKQLSHTFPSDFASLVADRRGDVYLAQGKRGEAGAEFLKAYQSLDEGTEYRRLVEVKLASLGMDVPSPATRLTGDKK